MRAQSYLFGVLVITLSLIAVAAAAYFAFTTRMSPAQTPIAELPTPPTPVPPPMTPPEEPAATTSKASEQNDLPTLTTPFIGARVKSPLPVTGSVIGTWYFEGSFPVVLVDASGNVIAQAPATAKGDWMSTSSVPFAVVLTWNSKTATSGILILKKDNPSGMPENDKQVSFPVVF